MLLPGDKIGPYTIRERAGQGGMAIVYQAWHEGLHRLEALKVPRGAGQTASDSAYIQRLLAEARVAAGLHHPNIVAIHGVSEPHAPIPFFAMDWVQGRDLAQILAQKRRFSLEETAQILAPVASALDYAHGRGVVHRDIKPANILLSEEIGVWVPKVVDFGISRAAEDDDLGGDTQLTRSGMIVGTPEYMSPEQAGSGEKVDFRTDIYSLGVVAYEMLCSEPPFTASSGVSRLSILISHVRDAAPLWDKFPDFPTRTGAVILRALSKRPADRPASCAEFVTALQATGESGSAFFGVQIPETAPSERTPFDESRFERDEAATIFERPISLSDTPPPGPAPTLLPPPKIPETALEMPQESATSSNFSPRGALPDAVAQIAAPASPLNSNFHPSHPLEEKIATRSAPHLAPPYEPTAPRIPPRTAPRTASKTALWAGMSGLLMGGALVLVLLGSHPGPATDPRDVAPHSAAELDSAAALPLQTTARAAPQRPVAQTRASLSIPAAPNAPAAPPRLRVVKINHISALAHKTITRRSARLTKGSRLLAQRGRAGARQTTLQISYRGSREVARRALAQRVMRPSQPEIVVIGTRAPAPLPRESALSPAPRRVRTARPMLRRPAFATARLKVRTQLPARKVAALNAAPDAVLTKRRPAAAISRVVRTVREAPLPP